jgi:hypothetical protein
MLEVEIRIFHDLERFVVVRDVEDGLGKFDGLGRRGKLEVEEGLLSDKGETG